MKSKFMILLLVITMQASSQEKKTVSNFISAYAGIEWNTLSGLTGAELERTLYRQRGWTAGIKLNHAFSYELGNAALFHSSSEGKADFTSLSSTVQYFTSQGSRGFLLHSSLGAGVRGSYYETASRHQFVPYFDAGFGFQFQPRHGVAVRWTNTISFAGRGGITLTKLSVCF